MVRRAKPQRKKLKCGCRPPKRSPYCAYCGTRYAGEACCGVCKEQGVDMPVIRGTSRRVCLKHKKVML